MKLPHRTALFSLFQKTKISVVSRYSTDLTVSGTPAVVGLALTLAALKTLTMGCTHLQQTGPGIIYQSTPLQKSCKIKASNARHCQKEYMKCDFNYFFLILFFHHQGTSRFQLNVSAGREYIALQVKSEMPAGWQNYLKYHVPAIFCAFFIQAPTISSSCLLH